MLSIAEGRLNRGNDASYGGCALLLKYAMPEFFSGPARLLRHRVCQHEGLTLVGGAVAVDCEGHGAVLAVFVRKRQARSHRHLAKDTTKVSSYTAPALHLHCICIA